MVIFNLSLYDFEYPDGKNALTVSRLLRDDDNPVLVRNEEVQCLTVSRLFYDDDNLVLVRNEEVKYYTLFAQVLTKIVYNNLLPKSGEYSHAWGRAPLLIYCLLKCIESVFLDSLSTLCFLNTS